VIGRLVGKLIEKMPPDLMLDVGGVGYEDPGTNWFYDGVSSKLV